MQPAALWETTAQTENHPCWHNKVYERNALWVIWCKEKDYCWHCQDETEQKGKNLFVEMLWIFKVTLKEHSEQIGLTKSFNFTWKGKLVAAGPDQYLLVNKSVMFFLSVSTPAITHNSCCFSWRGTCWKPGSSSPSLKPIELNLAEVTTQLVCH